MDQADIHHWDRATFGRYVGYLPQDVELFPGTVAYNIARLKQGVDSDDITQAARFAGAHQLITRLPDGYETVIQLGGAPLSGGQRQRIALARAFFGMPKFVVLDEPDANLDREGEQALVQTLMRAKKRGITTVTITQRPTLLEFVDKILVMKNGQIETYGPRNIVLGREKPDGDAAADTVEAEGAQGRLEAPDDAPAKT
jgi:ATP-binding cassette subfamily C protein